MDRVFYALHDTWTPVKAASLAFVINLVLGLILMWTPLNFGGLALANSLAALSEATLLMFLVRRRIPGLELGQIVGTLSRTVAASLLMGLTVAMLPRLLQDRLPLRDLDGAADRRGTGRTGRRHGLLRLLVSSTIGRVARSASARPSARLECGTRTLMGLAA